MLLRLLLLLHLRLLLQLLFVVLREHLEREACWLLTVDRRGALIVAHFFGRNVLAAGGRRFDIPAILTSLVLDVDNVHIRLAQTRVVL